MIKKETMKIETENYIHPKRPAKFGIEGFLENTFIQFKKELERLRQTIYDYEEYKDIFDLDERTWIGIFNTAIIKAFPNTSITLQEYGVYCTKNFVGRADLLVHWKDNKGRCFYLLFEAKKYKEKSIENLYDDSESDFITVLEQGIKYYEADLKYYKGKKVYVIPILFGRLSEDKKKRTGIINKAREYFEPAFNKEDYPTDFCSLYYEEENGVWVYGKIYPAKKKSNG